MITGACVCPAADGGARVGTATTGVTRTVGARVGAAVSTVGAGAGAGADTNNWRLAAVPLGKIGRGGGLCLA